MPPERKQVLIEYGVLAFAVLLSLLISYLG